MIGHGRIGGGGAAALRRLARAEDGALVVFSLFVLVVMLMAGGLAIDTMRHERERARLQTTLDRAVLAAADLRHTLPAEDVVRDYFAVAGLTHTLGEIEVEERINHRSASASASFDVRTALLHLVGIDTLTAAGAATAEETWLDIEVSLVLDVSGSMGRGTGRMEALRPAAMGFVNELMVKPMRAGSGGVTTMSLVPYATSVALPPEMFSLYDVRRLHDLSHCMLFEREEYRTTELSSTRRRDQYPHVQRDDDAYDVHPSGLGYLFDPRRVVYPMCQRAARGGEPERNTLVPLAGDPGVLRAAIGRLEPSSGTGMHDGMKWGVAMLDPRTRPVVEALAATGTVSAAADGRPYDYGRDTTLKIVVLISDGLIREQWITEEALWGRMSNVWHDPVTDRYSVLLRGSPREPVPLRQGATRQEGRGPACYELTKDEREALANDRYWHRPHRDRP